LREYFEGKGVIKKAVKRDDSAKGEGADIQAPAMEEQMREGAQPGD
jgi:hypothetical protein